VLLAKKEKAFRGHSVILQNNQTLVFSKCIANSLLQMSAATQMPVKSESTYPRMFLGDSQAFPESHLIIFSCRFIQGENRAISTRDSIEDKEKLFWAPTSTNQ
jgi:hypothetical protein